MERTPVTDVHILAISGSLRRESGNSALLRVAAAVSDAGVVVEPWPHLAQIPPFDEDAEHDVPAPVARMRAAVAAADAVLVSTPEYNGSVPGQLKNAMDWLSRPYGASVLTGAVVAVVGASPSRYGAAQAAEQLVTILDTAGATTTTRRFHLPHAHEAFTDDGRLADPEHEAGLRAVLHELAATAVTTRSLEPVG